MPKVNQVTTTTTVHSKVFTFAELAELLGAPHGATVMVKTPGGPAWSRSEYTVGVISTVEVTWKVEEKE